MVSGYKEKIIMHALYPKRQIATNTKVLNCLLFYACLFELVENGTFRIEDKKFWCKTTETKDPVVDNIISLLVPLSGKNLQRLQMVILHKAGGIYKKQMTLMTGSHLLSREDIIFISWKVGNRYRVRNHDLLKQGIARLERALVYGRDPDRETMIMTILLGEGNLFGNIFRTKEYRRKAKARYRELLKSDHVSEDHTIYQLRKSLKQTLNTK